MADESDSAESALRGLDVLQRRLDATYSGQPSTNLFIALAETIKRYQLPQGPFDDLLDAFRQDQRKSHYLNFEEVLDYCRRSANPVGRIVLRLGECFDDNNAEKSDLICTGLQLANFWQDVARDYAMGRIYIPGDEMQRHGVTESMLAKRSTPPELRCLLARECDRAEEFLRGGMPLAASVPRWLSADIQLFAHGGLETLRAIRRIDFDVLARRPTVTKWRQLRLVASALFGRL